MSRYRRLIIYYNSAAIAPLPPTQTEIDSTTVYCACRDALMQQMVAYVGPLAGLLTGAAVVAFVLVGATLGMQWADARADLRRLKQEEMQRHVNKSLWRRRFDAEMPWLHIGGGGGGGDTRFELQDGGAIVCVRDDAGGGAGLPQQEVTF